MFSRWLDRLSNVLGRFEFQILGYMLFVGATWIQNTLILVGYWENSSTNNWTNFWVSSILFLATIIVFFRW